MISDGATFASLIAPSFHSVAKGTKKMAKVGRKKLAESEKKKHQINCRVTDTELKIIDSRRGGIKKTEWLTRTALKKPPVIIPEINQKAWSELSRVASNLNQLTRAINKGLKSELKVNDLAELIEILKEVRGGLISK